MKYFCMEIIIPPSKNKPLQNLGTLCSRDNSKFAVNAAIAVDLGERQPAGSIVGAGCRSKREIMVGERNYMPDRGCHRIGLDTALYTTCRDQMARPYLNRICSIVSYFCILRRASINRPPTPDANEEPRQELTLQEVINIKLIESGEKEKLKELLRERLIECGWKDEMKTLCRAFTKKKGRNNVTVDDLVHVVTPKGRASVPDAVKAELLQRIRAFIVSAI
ncbi:hypothetical protein ACLOJK_001493 [Asimina triloba]